MFKHKYKIYDINRIQADPIAQMIFVYDELIKLLNSSMSESWHQRQKTIEKVTFIIQTLICSIVDSKNNDLTKQAKRLYTLLLKKVCSITYNKNTIICEALIKDIQNIKNHILLSNSKKN